MLAAYAKHGVASNTTPSIAVSPNPILYISIFPYFSEPELLKIFKSYDGFDSSRFFPTHTLVRFNTIENAKRALEDLNATTNLFANYSTKGAKYPSGNHQSGKVNNTNHRPSSVNGSSVDEFGSSVSSSTTTTTTNHNTTVQHQPTSNSTNQPKHTIHVTNIKMSLLSLKKFFMSLTGFKKVAFYQDYCFIIFADVKTATQAIEEILFRTKMKANFAKAEFTPHPLSVSAIGVVNSIIRVSDYPPNTTDADLIELFESYPGLTDIQFYQVSCLVYFTDTNSSTAALDDINNTTNLTAIYSKKGVNSKTKSLTTTNTTANTGNISNSNSNNSNKTTQPTKMKPPTPISTTIKQQTQTTTFTSTKSPTKQITSTPKTWTNTNSSTREEETTDDENQEMVSDFNDEFFEDSVDEHETVTNTAMLQFEIENQHESEDEMVPALQMYTETNPNFAHQTSTITNNTITTKNDNSNNNNHNSSGGTRSVHVSTEPKIVTVAATQTTSSMFLQPDLVNAGNANTNTDTVGSWNGEDGRLSTATLNEVSETPTPPSSTFVTTSTSITGMTGMSGTDMGGNNNPELNPRANEFPQTPTPGSVYNYVPTGIFEHQQELINGITAGLFKDDVRELFIGEKKDCGGVGGQSGQRQIAGGGCGVEGVASLVGKAGDVKMFIDSLVKRVVELESEVERLKKGSEQDRSLYFDSSVSGVATFTSQQKVGNGRPLSYQFSDSQSVGDSAVSGGSTMAMNWQIQYEQLLHEANRLSVENLVLREELTRQGKSGVGESGELRSGGVNASQQTHGNVQTVFAGQGGNNLTTTTGMYLQPGNNGSGYLQQQQPTQQQQQQFTTGYHHARQSTGINQQQQTIQQIQQQTTGMYTGQTHFPGIFGPGNMDTWNAQQGVQQQTQQQGGVGEHGMVNGEMQVGTTNPQGNPYGKAIPRLPTYARW
ncbi:hypothetical protein HK098_001260 [Nowakowskiella sp. JEL0407]|nr:hypothetical protein HK098_001260 [Nowakowskiella sp. JEL0407]